MRTSETCGALFEALAKAQAEIANPEKTKTAKLKGETKDGRKFDYTYKYADVADVLNGVRPVLGKNGLCVTQATAVEGSAIYLVTRIGHASGEWLESDYPVGSIQGDHQKMGAALTYARRYALCSLIGVAAEEDVDGQGADEATPYNRQTRAVAASRQDNDFPGDMGEPAPGKPSLQERANKLLADARSCRTTREWIVVADGPDAVALARDLERSDPDLGADVEQQILAIRDGLDQRAAA